MRERWTVGTDLFIDLGRVTKYLRSEEKFMGLDATLKSNVANVPAIISTATALAANQARKSWSIQNLGTNPLFVRLGASASTTTFHRVLKGGSANDDGLGGTLEDDLYTGVVSIAGTSPRFVVTEL